MSIWQVISNAKDVQRRHGPRYLDPHIYDHDQKPKHKSSKFTSWTKWPNPFGKIEDISVTACGPEIQLNILMWGSIAAGFFLSNFVPDPKELTRNWLTGKYRCGIKFDFNVGPEVETDVQAFGPLDILWQDGSASLVARGSLLPVLEGFYFVWATGTAFAALSMFNTAILRLAACGSDQYAVNLALGDAESFHDTDEGAVNAYNVLSDPFGFANALDGFVLLSTEAADFDAFGHVTSFGRFVDSCEIWFTGIGVTSEHVIVGPLSPGGIAAWHIAGSKIGPDHSEVQVHFKLVQHGASIANTFIDCVRFTVREYTGSHLSTGPSRHHDRRCWAEGQPELALNPLPY